eukprot:EG_transcript_312
MSEFDLRYRYLPKYHQQPVTQPLFGQRPRIRLEVLSSWGARLLFFSFYSSIIGAVALQFFSRGLLWDCSSACGNYCGRLPSLDLEGFGNGCAVRQSWCSGTTNASYERLDTTRANAVVWDPQVTAAACPPLNDTTSPACVAGTAPLAAWQAVPLYLHPFNRHLVVSLVVRNTARLRRVADALPPPTLQQPLPGTPWSPSSLPPTAVARLHIELSLQVGEEVRCLREYYWLSCPRNARLCESIEILTLNDLTVGNYSASVTVREIQWAVDLPDDVLQAATNSIIMQPDGMNVALFFHRALYVLILVIVRYLLMGLALVWLWRYCRLMEFRKFSDWLPEQAWVFIVQLLLILYLNPFFLPSLLYRDLGHWQARLYFFFEHPFELIFINFERAFELVLLESVRGGALVLCGLFSLPTVVSALWFGCTVAPCIVVLYYRGWSYNPGYLPRPDLDFGAVVGVVDALQLWADWFLTWLWYLWVLKAIVSTHYRLKRLPYLQTRWRQLSLRFYTLIYISKVLYSLVQAFYLYNADKPRAIPLSLEDSPASDVGDFIKNAVIVFLFAHVYKPATGFKVGGPPAPGLRWWTKIKWPAKWVNWLERNGSAMYFFLYESEKLEYAQAQRMGHTLEDPSLMQKLLENMGEFKDYLWENMHHVRDSLLTARLRVMAIPAHVRGLFQKRDRERAAAGTDPDAVATASPRSQPDTEGASVRNVRVDMEKLERSHHLAHELRDSHVVRNPFYCVELAVEMWNFSWEVYFKEPPDLRPHRHLSAAHAAALAVLPRFKSDGYVSRHQYLHNSVHSWKPFAELPAKDVPLTIKHWPLPSATYNNQTRVREQHPRTKSVVSVCWSDFASELDGQVSQTLSQLCVPTQLASSSNAGPEGAAGPLRRPNPASPSAQGHLALPTSSTASRRPPVAPGPLPTRVRLNIPSQPLPPPEGPEATAVVWPLLWLQLHTGAPPEPEEEAYTPLRRIVDFLPDAGLRSLALTCRAGAALATEWRPGDIASRSVSPTSSIRPFQPPSRAQGSGPGASFTPMEMSVPLPSSSGQLEIEMEDMGSSDHHHLRGPSDLEEALMRMMEPSLLQLEQAMRQTPGKKKVKRKVVLPEFMDVKQYGYEMYAVINWNSNQAIVCEGKDKIVVAFRGTDNFDNLASDVRFMRTPVVQMLPHSANLKRLITSFGFEVLPKAHSGFYAAYNSVREDTLRAVRTLALSRPHKRICCTGHSLGGALAIFAAYDITKMLEGREVTMYNFGGPRVGNNTFRLLYDHAVPDSYRTVNDQDVVPSIPPPVTVLGGMFHHVGKEVRIDAKGNMIIQPTFLEKSFVSGNSRIGPHKMENYKRSLEAVCMYFRMELPPERMPWRLLMPAPANPGLPDFSD